MSSPHPQTFAISCVVDKHPRFLAELVLWAHCVTRYLPSDRFRPVVYFVDGCHKEVWSWLAEREFAVCPATQIVAGSPHCNKITPLLDEHTADWTIVTDTDLFLVRDPSAFFRSDRIRAAPNNHSIPPDYILKAILKESNINAPFRSGFALYPNLKGIRETHINNISAGIVAIPRGKAKHLGVQWKRWAEWIIRNPSLLSRWGIHVDQVAFMLAMEEGGEDVEHLPPQLNTILHSLKEMSTVYAFHLTPAHIPSFPNYFNADRTMKSSGFAPGVCEAIELLNECIEDAVDDIVSLAKKREPLEYFLNPLFRR